MKWRCRNILKLITACMLPRYCLKAGRQHTWQQDARCHSSRAEVNPKNDAHAGMVFNDEHFTKMWIMSQKQVMVRSKTFASWAAWGGVTGFDTRLHMMYLYMTCWWNLRPRRSRLSPLLVPWLPARCRGAVLVAINQLRFTMVYQL